jgi:SOS-response transcriptional repressor LexA
MIKLTARQEQILALIRNAIENTGFPPTRAEIANELGEPLNNIKIKLLRAKKLLAEIIEKKR